MKKTHFQAPEKIKGEPVDMNLDYVPEEKATTKAEIDAILQKVGDEVNVATGLNEMGIEKPDVENEKKDVE